MGVGTWLGEEYFKLPSQSALFLLILSSLILITYRRNCGLLYKNNDQSDPSAVA